MLLTHQEAITAADLLNDRVVPFFVLGASVLMALQRWDSVHSGSKET